MGIMKPTSWKNPCAGEPHRSSRCHGCRALYWLQRREGTVRRCLDQMLRLVEIALAGKGRRSIRFRFGASLAQLAEQLTLNQRVDGSSPSGGNDASLWLNAR